MHEVGEAHKSGGRLLSLAALVVWVSGGGCSNGTGTVSSTAEVSGKVVEEGTERPIAGARIKVAEQSTASDDSGIFQISGLPLGRQNLVVEAAGYRTLERTLELLAGKNALGTIALAPLGCVPDCGDRKCGAVPNGCGENCGDCGKDQRCDEGTGRCVTVVNPCAGVDCSGHGTCTGAGGKPACLCEEGYYPEAGLQCVASLEDACLGAGARRVEVSTDGSADYTCDGGSDQVQINQALVDVNAGGGGVVHLRKGRYVIDDSVVLPSRTVLEGDGFETIIWLVDHAHWPKHRPLIRNAAFESKDVVDECLRVRSLKVDGNSSAQDEAGGDYYYNTIHLDGIHDVKLSGLWVGNNRNDNIKISNSYREARLLIENCTLDYSNHSGIYLIDTNDVVVRGNKILVDANSGVRSYNSNKIVIQGNDIFGAQYGGDWGIQLEQLNWVVVDDVLIADNKIHDVPDAGIIMYAMTPTNASVARGVRVIGNQIFQNRESYAGVDPGGGIVIVNFDGVLIENNTIFNNEGSGISYAQTTYHVAPVVWPIAATVKNNIIVGNTAFGILSDSKEATFDALFNDVWDNAKGDYQSAAPGNGSISEDPQLAAAPRVTDWHADPGQLTVDLHLKSTAGRWDGAAWVQDQIDSSCIDAGDPSSAFANEQPPNGGRIDMGAFGNTREASKSR